MQNGQKLNELTETIIGFGMTVHSVLGPGLLERAYEACLEFELPRQGLCVERQKPLPIVYQDVELDAEYRVDLLVERQVILEIKAVDKLTSVHETQLLLPEALRVQHWPALLNVNVGEAERGHSTHCECLSGAAAFLCELCAVEGAILKEGS